MESDHIQIIFFENKKWYMLLAKLIQYVSSKVYTREPILISHVAFVYNKKVYEFRWRKNYIISNYNKAYIKECQKTNNLYSCNLCIDKFNYTLLRKLKEQKYCLISALAGYNSVILLGKKIGCLFNKILDIFRDIDEEKKTKQYCSKFLLLMYLNSLKKNNRSIIINKFHDFLLSEYRSAPHESYNMDKSMSIEMISRESIPQDLFVFFREVKKLEIKKLYN